jgi:hypothetical protein
MKEGVKTMSKSRLLLAALLAVAASITVARAAGPAAKPAEEADRQLLLDTIRSNRKAMVAASLGLSPEEGAKFWPIYDRYQEQMNVSGDRMSALVDDYIAHYRDLSNEKALELAQEYLAAEAQRLETRRTFLPEFSKELPGRTVARFYQIENKMDAVIRYDLAAVIPVVEERPAK